MQMELRERQNLEQNAILAVSIASARAAISLDIPLYRFLGGIFRK